MITDLKQSAQHWIASALENCGQLLKEGEDPSFVMTFGGVEMEFRINKIPGQFERVEVTITGEDGE